MFSKTCEYAIRALIFVAQKSRNGGRTGIKEIANGIDSPEYFIAKILQDLSRKGFVQSAKGPTGGFFMEAEELNISLSKVVIEMDGDKLFSGCGLGLKECSENHPCPIHHEFKTIRSEIKSMLEHSTFEMFVDNLEQKLTFLKK